MHKITIRKKDYKRPKRLFFKGQKERKHPSETTQIEQQPSLQYDANDANKIDEISKQNNAFEETKLSQNNTQVNINEQDTVSKQDEIQPLDDNNKINHTFKQSDQEQQVQQDQQQEQQQEQQDHSKSMDNVASNDIDENLKTHHEVENSNDETAVKNHLTEDYRKEKTSKTIIKKNRDINTNKKPKQKQNGRLSVALFSLLLGTLIGILLFSYFYKDTNNAQETSTEQAIAKAKKYVVSVVNLQKANKVERKDAKQNPEEAGIGSGVIYKVEKDKAYIVTNHHVIGNANKIEVTANNGKKAYAKVVGSDMWTDLAVITIPKSKINNGITFSDSDKTIVGQSAIAIGSPLGEMFAGSVSQGIVSGLHRSVPVDIDGDNVYDWEMNVIQTDAAINPGNSGGALINQSGQLIGINSMKITMEGVEGIGFSIPSNEVKKVIKVLEKNHEIKRPKLGLLLEDLNVTSLQTTLPNEVKNGVVITDVEPNSISQIAGLQQSDVIVALDDKKIKSRIELRKYIFNEKHIGDKVKVTYYRGQTKNNVTMTLK